MSAPMQFSPMLSMNSPRKFSDKIAIHQQKLKKENESFEQIMAEVHSVTAHDPGCFSLSAPIQGAPPRRSVSLDHSGQSLLGCVPTACSTEGSIEYSPSGSQNQMQLGSHVAQFRNSSPDQVYTQQYIEASPSTACYGVHTPRARSPGSRAHYHPYSRSSSPGNASSYSSSPTGLSFSWTQGDFGKNQVTVPVDPARVFPTYTAYLSPPANPSQIRPNRNPSDHPPLLKSRSINTVLPCPRSQQFLPNQNEETNRQHYVDLSASASDQQYLLSAESSSHIGSGSAPNLINSQNWQHQSAMRSSDPSTGLCQWNMQGPMTDGTNTAPNSAPVSMLQLSIGDALQRRHSLQHPILSDNTTLSFESQPSNQSAGSTVPIQSDSFDRLFTQQRSSPDSRASASVDSTMSSPSSVGPSCLSDDQSLIEHSFVQQGFENLSVADFDAAMNMPTVAANTAAKHDFAFADNFGSHQDPSQQESNLFNSSLGTEDLNKADLINMGYSSPRNQSTCHIIPDITITDHDKTSSNSTKATSSDFSAGFMALSDNLKDPMDFDPFGEIDSISQSIDIDPTIDATLFD